MDTEQSELYSQSQDTMIGSVFAEKYEIISKLGDGGMGSVYKARDTVLNRLVAIKILVQNQIVTDKTLRRFQREAQAIGRLDHPNLVKIFELNKTNQGLPYLVMEYIEGSPLSEVLKDQTRLAQTRCIELFSLLCEALQHAHDHNVIHRDLKPSNVILITKDGRDSAMIVDFGVAKITSEETTGALTQSGEVFGSPLYMSPEQGMGRGVDHRTDQYSMGCMLYECLSGVPPFIGQSNIETLLKHQTETPKRLTEACSLTFSEAMEDIVGRLLSKDPEARYPSMNHVREALLQASNVLHIPTLAPLAQLERKPGPGPGPGQTKAHIAPTTLAGLFVLILLVIAYAVFNSAPQNQSSKPAIEKSTTAAEFQTSLSTDPSAEHILAARRLKSILMQDVRITSVRVGRDIDDAGLAALKSVNQIQNLSLQDCDCVTSKGLVNITHLPLLELTLAQTSVDDSGMSYVSQLKQLRYLNLDKTKIGDNGIAMLGGLTQLCCIHAGDTLITDKGLAALSQLPNLIALDVSRCSITDKGLTQLRGSRIQKLFLSSTKISDKAVDTLLTMRSLTKLMLSSTSITDRALQRLSSLKHLNCFSVDGCTQVHQKAIDEFKAKLPKCDVRSVQVGRSQRIWMDKETP